MKNYQTETFDNIYQVIFLYAHHIDYDNGYECPQLEVINMTAESEKDCWNKLCELLKTNPKISDHSGGNSLTESLEMVDSEYTRDYLSTKIMGESLYFNRSGIYTDKEIEVQIKKLKVLYAE